MTLFEPHLRPSLLGPDCVWEDAFLLDVETLWPFGEVGQLYGEVRVEFTAVVSFCLNA